MKTHLCVFTRSVLQVPYGVPGRAYLTIPPEVSLQKSIIEDAGIGVITNTFIPRYTWLGEYEGEMKLLPEFSSGYSWRVSRKTRNFDVRSDSSETEL